MAKAWKDVIASPQYQALTEEQKAQAQAQYFDEVVAPKAGDKWAEARDQFYAAYPPPQQQKEEPSLMQQAGDWLTGGQSAGQIAEQAGRGLVNIPFDVLQGGASLINAISQGLGGPKVLDDVYRPVERPTDPYAQAGETIGGYLLPIGTAAKAAGATAKLAGDIGSAGNMIAGSLADAANQKGDFAQNAAKNAGVNLAAQGVLSAAAKGIGRGITAVRGEISPADQQLLKRAAAADVPVMTSDVVPPKTKLGNQLQGYSEGVIAGTGPMRAAQQDARTKLVNRFTEKYGDYDPSVVVDSLKSGVAREKSLAKSKLNSLSGRMVGKPVDTSGAIRAIDGAVNELGKLKGVSDTQTISALNDYKNAIQEITNGDDAFELLDKLRTQFRIDVKGDRTVLPSMSQTMVDRVYNSLTNSLSKSIAKGLSPKDASAWRAGKADYAKMATHVTQTRLKNWICPYISRHLLSLNPLLACCRRYSR
uniref:DNA transfer protein n=1 Tax=Escherichia coli TaxID=562 RepID=UPI003A97641F